MPLLLLNRGCLFYPCEMARKRYEEWGLDLAALDAGLYLHTPWNGGIDREAERFLSWTRDLTVRLCGAN